MREYITDKCEICNKQGMSIIRTKYTCKLCYYLLQKDNMRLFKSGEDITEDLSILRKCSRFKCRSKIIGKISYNQTKPDRYGVIFCSPQCKEKHHRRVYSYFE